MEKRITLKENDDTLHIVDAGNEIEFIHNNSIFKANKEQIIYYMNRFLESENENEG